MNSGSCRFESCLRHNLSRRCINDELTISHLLIINSKPRFLSQKRKTIMSNSRKSTTPATKKAAPAAKKAAPVKKVMPKTAKVATAVAPVKTIGQLVEDELRARGITAATTVT